MLKLFEQLGPIDGLIQRGRELRAQGNEAEAMLVYTEAWRVAEELDDDALRVASSHMLGVVEPDLARKLDWNLASLRAASALDDALAVECYPTVHANLGYAYLALGKRDEARHHYELARDFAVTLDGPYGEQIRGGINAMLNLLASPG